MTNLKELTRELINNHIYARIPLIADAIGSEYIEEESENYSEVETSSYYLVSEWLGARLTEEGEQVNRQFDCPIWCRKSGGIALEDEFLFQQIAKVQSGAEPSTDFKKDWLKEMFGDVMGTLDEIQKSLDIKK